MVTIKPPRLQPGDTVGICCPSGTIAHKQDMFERAVEKFAAASGLKLQIAPNTLNKHYYSAGTPEERLTDFHALVKDPNVKAIILAAGGDTAIDLVEHLDYDLIKNNPKIITGISDATTLLSPITAKTGLITFLGFEFLDFADHPMTYELAGLKKAWFEGEMGCVQANPDWIDLRQTYTCYEGWSVIKPGKATGQLVGGNFQSFIQLVGTQYELSIPGAILFLETYKLPKKQIHKGLMQLKLHGVLGNISGLVVGYCVESDDPAVVGNEQPMTETVLEVVKDYDFPVMQIGEIGHFVENTLQPIGAQAHLDTAKLHFEILEAVTQ